MAERTVAEKLHVKSGDIVGLVGAAEAEAGLMRPLPAGSTLINGLLDAQVAIVFVHDLAELKAQLSQRLPHLQTTRAVWICYPKGGRADINRDSIMREAGPVGWRAISNIAINDTWSAVRVRPLKPGEAPLG
jgi:hypothetical protein